MSVKAVVIPVSLKEKPYITTIEDYKSYYPIIGCRAFDVVSLDEYDHYSVDCFVDDEGQLNGSPVNQYFLRAYRAGLVHYPLFGIGVVNLTDLDTGESAELDSKLVKDTLKKYGFIDSELSNLD